MKIGGLTQIENGVATCTVLAEPGFEEENILDINTLKLWKVEGSNLTLTIECDPFIAQAICLFNLEFESELELITYSAPAVPIETHTYFPADRRGLDSMNLLCVLTDTTTPIVQIDLIFSGYDDYYETYCGFIWAGLWKDFGCLEKVMPTDISNDDLNITRYNRPDTKRSYNYQQYSATIKKENEFYDLREFIRFFLALGYGNPRPFLIDEPFLPDPEVFLGVFDSPKFQYDIFNLNDTFIAQLTIGIREVF